MLRVRETPALTGDQIRRDMEMVDNVDENIEPEGSIVSGFMVMFSIAFGTRCLSLS